MNDEENGARVPEQDLAAQCDDGFEGFVDEYEGGSEGINPRMIIGSLLKFTNDYRWTAGEGVDLGPEQQLIAYRVVRCVQKWLDQRPVETRIVPPHQPFPNVEEMNKACPKTEWNQDLNGNARGPWQAQRIAYFTDPKTLDRFTFATGTVGGSIAIQELAEKVAWVQRYHGDKFVPLVRPSSVHMPTQYGGRMRPHFHLVQWLAPGGGSGGEPLPLTKLPTNSIATTILSEKPVEMEIIPPAAAKSKDKAAKTKKPDTAGMKTVNPPTLSEEMGDKIKF